MNRARIPSDWSTIRLSRIANIQTGLAKGKQITSRGVSLPYLRVANVQDGHLDLDEIKTIVVDEKDVERYRLKIGDVLFTEGGDFDKLGRGTVWRGEVQNCLHQNHVFAVRPNPDLLLPDYLAYLAAAPHGKRYFQSASKQSTNLASINSTQLNNFPVILPPLAEQRRLIAILRTWDEAIHKKCRVIEIKKRLSSYLADRLLVLPTLKLDPSHKSARTLSAFTYELTDRNAANVLGRDLVMGVSNANGIVPMRAQTIGSDLSRYKVLPPKAFAYNPMRINVGSIAMSRLGSDVLVSPDYVLFACKENVLDPDYFDHLCSTHWWKHHINESGSGSVRQRIYYADLAALRIVIPPFEKQKQIANCLSQATREIELIEAQIAALNKQKRGLMQKLLTGEWRLKP